VNDRDDHGAVRPEAKSVNGGHEMESPSAGDIKVGMILWSMQSLEANEQMVGVYEQLGMDSVWVIDHLLGVAHPEHWKDIPASAMLDDPDAFLDPIAVAAAVGRSTDLLLGSAVIDLTKRRAADWARALLTVHHASRTGFKAGVGSGLDLNLKPFGYEYKKRVSKFEETIRELRCLLDTGRMPEGVGRVGLPLESAAGRPELWVAAHGPRMRGIAGRYGDGWMVSGGGIGPEQFAEGRQEVLAAAETAGRPVPTCAYTMFTFIGESRDAIAATLEETPLAKLLLLFAPASLWERHGIEHPGGPKAAGYPDVLPHAMDPELLREVAPRIPFELFEEFVILGNAEEIAARLQPYVEAGCEHLILGDATGFAVSPELMASGLPEYGRVREILKANVRSGPARVTTPA
jgi:phthiodiolone/phenolphthiodiolone dimycocerosates ketoreductase